MIYSSLSAENSGFVEIGNKLFVTKITYGFYLFAVAIKIGTQYTQMERIRKK